METAAVADAAGVIPVSARLEPGRARGRMQFHQVAMGVDMSENIWSGCGDDDLNRRIRTEILEAVPIGVIAVEDRKSVV